MDLMGMSLFPTPWSSVSHPPPLSYIQRLLTRTITRPFSLCLMSFYTPCLCLCLSIRPDASTFPRSHVLLAAAGFFICILWLRLSLSPQTTHPCLPDLGHLGRLRHLHKLRGRSSVRWVTPRRTDMGTGESELLPSSTLFGPCLLREVPMLPHPLLSFQSPALIPSHPVPSHTLAARLVTCLTGMPTYLPVLAPILGRTGHVHNPADSTPLVPTLPCLSTVHPGNQPCYGSVASELH